MDFKNIIEEKIWVLGIALLICTILTLNKVYFISNVAQNIYYGIYVALSIIGILTIRKQYDLRIHHGVFIIFNFLVIFVAYLDHFIALPLILIFPLLCAKKCHIVFKIFSAISYILLLVMMSFTLFVRLFFTSTTLVKTINSPNNKQQVEVYSIDQGGLGGSTRVDLAKKYCYIFKKNQRIYLGDYGEDRDVRWVDSNHVQIQSKIIDVTLR
ncbi:DUF5412 family protein [Clostridium sp. BSD9I1]|uniref:DUF5412 family protein n=1 Tax=Clostridium sp. BSD9I1 TaxID=2003589 RepID=UPI001646F543|nr:DUF5412 family protein [Clostridium sp. BSD9I1]